MAPVEWSLAWWMHSSRCSWQQVSKLLAVVTNPEPTSPQPECGAAGFDSASMAYAALDDSDSCERARLCTGNAAARLLNTSNEQRLRQRRRLGFAHVIKPHGCALRLLDEDDVARCLGRRKVLNVGSDVAVNLQRGFGRLNSTLRAWTMRRPGTAAEQRLPFAQRQPSVADWSYQFERTGGFNSRLPDLMVGKAVFGHGSVQTMFIHHPPHYGLANVLEPEAVPGFRVGFRRWLQYERFFCQHDVLIFESGVHDFGLPFGPLVAYGKSALRPACASASTPDACVAALTPALRNETWRLRPLEAYAKRLRTVLAMWGRCREANPRFRPIFKLAPAARSRRRPAECSVAQWGFNSEAHHVAAFNRVARDLVEAAGFEVFDAFGVTLHAPSEWFDPVRHGVVHKIHEVEAVSDVETQMLLNQLCATGDRGRRRGRRRKLRDTSARARRA